MRRPQLVILVIGILVLAVFFRFYGLKSIPPGLYVDEATNGNNAIEALETDPPAEGLRVFYPENNGREGLFINIQALSLKIFGNEAWALRLISAIFGTLTVLGVYLLTKELLRPSAGLLAAFFVAVSFWHINFSRVGFRAISASFFLVFGFYFLLKAFRAANSNSKIYILNSIFSGLAFGLGFHTYIAYRVLPLLFAIVLWLQWRNTHPQYRRQFLISIFYFLFSIFLVALPLVLYFLDHPDDFLGRAAKVSAFQKPLKESLRNIVLTLGMFHIRGDWNWRHNFAGQPLLWWPVGIFFLIGLISTTRKLKTENWQLKTALPILWLAVMLIPNLISPEGSPHALRALGALPSVFIISAIGATLVGDILRKWLPKMFPLIVVWFLMMHIGVTWRDYFIRFANHPKVAEAFSANYVEEAELLRVLPTTMPKYVVINFGWDDVIVRDKPAAAQTVIFLAGGWNEQKWQKQNLHFIREEELKKLAIPSGSVLIPLQPLKETEAIIKSRWPKARIIKLRYGTYYRI